MHAHAHVSPDSSTDEGEPPRVVNVSSDSNSSDSNCGQQVGECKRPMHRRHHGSLDFMSGIPVPGKQADSSDDMQGATNDSPLSMQKSKFAQDLGHHIEWLKKRQSLLTLKYSDLKWWSDSFQISAIVVSTLLTCFETVKSELRITEHENIHLRRTFTLLPILGSSYIALCLSILRFKRFVDRTEQVTKISERAVFVACRLRKVQYMALMCTTLVDFEAIKTSYSNETFDLYIDIKAQIEKNLKFKEIIKYKNKYIRILHELEEQDMSSKQNELRLQGGAMMAPTVVELRTNCWSDCWSAFQRILCCGRRRG